jgi:hypothetical protein
MTNFAKAWALGAAVAALAVSLSPSAAAQQPKPAEKEKSGYSYRFDDDLMKGGTLGGNTPRIEVVKMGRRDRLIRPRLHFVPEMLKSVEKM